jgi:hypothetical protein
VDSAVLLAKCAMALVGAGETGFRVCRATLVREKSLRGAVSLLFVSPSSPRMTSLFAARPHVSECTAKGQGSLCGA